ncbi:MAG: hypothetical protein KA297_18940 [Kofleriaceae bacterium]|jgi:hypothetical protein|nr:hypothetical protein [Kofleriaceae bacterium]
MMHPRPWPAAPCLPPVVLTLALALVGCDRRVSGVDQAADAVVLDHKASVVAAGLVSSHETSLTVGTVDRGTPHEVPVKLEWFTVLDPLGCARIRAVRMTRTGGDRGFEIYDTRVITLNEQCGTVGAAGDVKAHQDVVVRYCYRWNGAANRATCAYDGAITLRGSLGVVTGTTTPVVRP